MAKQLGHFEITAKVGRLAFKLPLPASMSRVHPVFHIFLLRCPKDGGHNAAPSPAMLLDSFEPTTMSTLCLGRVWGLRNMHGFLSTSLRIKC